MLCLPLLPTPRRLPFSDLFTFSLPRNRCRCRPMYYYLTVAEAVGGRLTYEQENNNEQKRKKGIVARQRRVQRQRRTDSESGHPKYKNYQHEKFAVSSQKKGHQTTTKRWVKRNKRGEKACRRADTHTRERNNQTANEGGEGKVNSQQRIIRTEPL